MERVKRFYVIKESIKIEINMYLFSLQGLKITTWNFLNYPENKITGDGIKNTSDFWGSLGV